MKDKTITVVGNIGAGKSTIVGILEQSLPARIINADPFEKNPFLELYSNDHTRWSLATELFFTLERAEILKKELSNSRGMRLIDSGLLMGIDVYANHHLDVGSMTKPEWDLYERIIGQVIDDKMIYPDVAIILDCSVEECMLRIKERGREFELDHKYEYLLGLQRRLDLLVEKLESKKVKVIKLDTLTVDYRDPIKTKELVSQIKATMND
jgi:deoxyadenosine/deoxycytidine kinase